MGRSPSHYILTEQNPVLWLGEKLKTGVLHSFRGWTWCWRKPALLGTRSSGTRNVVGFLCCLPMWTPSRTLPRVSAWACCSSWSALQGSSQRCQRVWAAAIVSLRQRKKKASQVLLLVNKGVFLYWEFPVSVLSSLNTPNIHWTDFKEWFV